MTWHGYFSLCNIFMFNFVTEHSTQAYKMHIKYVTYIIITNRIFMNNCKRISSIWHIIEKTIRNFQSVIVANLPELTKCLLNKLNVCYIHHYLKLNFHGIIVKEFQVFDLLLNKLIVIFHHHCTDSLLNLLLNIYYWLIIIIDLLLTYYWTNYS